MAVTHCSDNCLNETSHLETARGSPDVRKFEACYRWAIDTKEDLAFTVILQGLPMSAEQAVSKPYLTGLRARHLAGQDLHPVRSLRQKGLRVWAQAYPLH
jgi:hypothetical protein